MEKTSSIMSEWIGVREIGRTAHDFFRRVLRFGPVLPKQQQADDHTPDRRDDGEVTGNLGWIADVVSGVNTWYGQECHVAVQQHRPL